MARTQTSNWARCCKLECQRCEGAWWRSSSFGEEASEWGGEADESGVVADDAKICVAGGVSEGVASSHAL